MSLSNKCIPPLGRPSTLNVGIVGVGTGAAMVCLRVAVNEKVVLSGVPRDASEPSGLDIDRVRCLRLRDDLFFLIPSVEPLGAFGELGTRVESFDMALLSAGVAGDMVNVASMGLGAGGSGDGARRPEG